MPEDLDIVGDVVDDEDAGADRAWRCLALAPRNSRTLASIWRGL